MADVDWKFGLNHASIIGGGGGKFTNPGKLKGIRMWDYKTPVDWGVGCAAVCLVRGIDKHERNVEGIRERDFSQKCIDMQDNCAFPDPFYVTLDEFYLFTDLYPMYRVVIYTAQMGLPRIIQGIFIY